MAKVKLACKQNMRNNKYDVGNYDDWSSQAHRLTAANAAYLEKKTNSSSAKLISKIIVINATLIEEFSTL